MVVTCAFYGFINRTTKVTLQVDREALEVGQSFTFEGDQYVILSVFEADDHYRANVGPEHLQRIRTAARLKAPALNTPVAAPKDATQSMKHGQETVLQARLKAAEARLEDVLRERDEALKLLDHAIQQLDRLQQRAEH
jgi:exonuclease VII small subunit